MLDVESSQTVRHVLVDLVKELNHVCDGYTHAYVKHMREPMKMEMNYGGLCVNGMPIGEHERSLRMVAKRYLETDHQRLGELMASIGQFEVIHHFDHTTKWVSIRPAEARDARWVSLLERERQVQQSDIRDMLFGIGGAVIEPIEDPFPRPNESVTREDPTGHRLARRRYKQIEEWEKP